MKIKNRTILCLMITATLLMIMSGINAASEERGQKIYYFNSYSPFEAWQTNPGYMVDGNVWRYASTTIHGDVERCLSNNCTAEQGTITTVEIRANAFYERNWVYLVLRPVFGGTTDGDDYIFIPQQGGPPGSWSQWFDITNDTNGPGAGRWTWNDVVDLDCDVEARLGTVDWPFTLHCSMVQIRVTFTP